MATKAELQAILDCDNKPFIRAMDAAVRKQKQAGATMTKSWGGVGGAIAGAAGRFLPMAAVAAGAAAAGKSVFNMAGNIKDMADSVALTTDQFQKYSFAMEQAGGSEEVLVKTMGAIIAKLDEAKTEGGKAAEQLAAIGVKAEELDQIQPAEILLRMADALKDANGNAEAIAKVMDVVGTKLGLKVVPALKDGSAAFLEMGNSAAIMTEKSVNAMEGLGDQLNKLKKQAQANIGNAFGGIIGLFGGDKKKEPQMSQPRQTPVDVMDPITVSEKYSFWKKELPKFTKPTGNEEQYGPFANFENGAFAGVKPDKFTGFRDGYFPKSSGGLTTGGLTTGGLTTGGLGNNYSADAYGKVRRGDAARAKRAAREGAQGSDPANTATAENTAKLVEIWGGTGRRK